MKVTATLGLGIGAVISALGVRMGQEMEDRPITPDIEGSGREVEVEHIAHPPSHRPRRGAEALLNERQRRSR